jgi:hypothetical protein
MKDAPSIFISNEVWSNVHSKRMKGFEFSPIGYGQYLKSVWIQN